jgi:hypothetical protein
MSISTTLTMLQLDSAKSLTNSKEFFNNEKGISQWRQNYQKQWMERHSKQRALPFELFNDAIDGNPPISFGAEK